MKVNTSGFNLNQVLDLIFSGKKKMKFRHLGLVDPSFATKVEIPFFFIFFFSFGKVGEEGIHVEILGNIVATGENFPIWHLYL